MARWRLLASERVLTSPWLVVDRNSYGRPDGSVIPDYYLVRRRDFVIVVALLADDRDVLLVRQYRPTSDRAQLEAPAGFIDEGEQPADAARRELLEETGYAATALTSLGVLRPLSGYLQTTAHVFLARCAPAPARPFDAQEIDEVVRLPFTDVLALIRDGEVDEMETVAAVLRAKDWLDQPR